MTTQALPDLKGFNTYYGLQVSDIGEDGAVLVLGHHHNDPLRVIAALNQHARTLWTCSNLLDRPGAEVADLAGALSETYAAALNDCGDSDHDPNCFRCREIAEGDWWIEWNRDEGDPGAFPVTMWRP
jgi:hypothetical protein